MNWLVSGDFILWKVIACLVLKMKLVSMHILAIVHYWINWRIADEQIFNGMAKKWLMELKESTEEWLQAHFLFQKTFVGSMNRICCRLCSSVNQVMDRFSPCKVYVDIIESKLHIKCITTAHNWCMYEVWTPFLFMTLFPKHPHFLGTSRSNAIEIALITYYGHILLFIWVGYAWCAGVL